MTDLTLILANLWRRKIRTILLLVSITIAFLIFGLLSAFNRTFTIGESLSQANRLMVASKVNFTNYLPLAHANRIAQVDGVTNVNIQSWFGGFYKEPKSVMTMFATDPGSLLAISPELRLSDEERKAFLSQRDGLLVGADVAKQFGWKVGDRVPIKSNIFSNKAGGVSWNFVISGIYTLDNAKGAASIVYCHYPYFNESITFGRDQMSFAVITTRSVAENDAVLRRVDALFANSADETNTMTEAAFSKAFVNQFGNISLILKLVVGAAFVTILMIVGNTMVMAIRERTREIGILKALGFDDKHVFKIILGESLALAITGGILGLILAKFGAIGLAKAVGPSFPGIDLTALIVVEGMAFALILGLATGALPAFVALRLSIVNALGRN